MFKIPEVKVILKEPKMSFLPRDLRRAKFQIWNLEISTFVISDLFPSFVSFQSYQSKVSAVVLRDRMNEFD